MKNNKKMQGHGCFHLDIAQCVQTVAFCIEDARVCLAYEKVTSVDGKFNMQLLASLKTTQERLAFMKELIKFLLTC